MKTLNSALVLVCTIVLLALALPTPIVWAATFSVVDYAVTVDLAGQTATFVITFSQPPDFASVDSANRRAHSFQVFTNGDQDVQPDSYVPNLRIIHGDEIDLTNHTLPIRQFGGDGGPGSGGWGPIVAEVPFSLEGGILTFTANLQDMDVQTTGQPDGDFGFVIFTTEYGSLTGPYMVDRSIQSCDAAPETCGTDADGDGVVDEEDEFVLSDLRETVFVGTCETGINNHLFPTGATFNDLIIDAWTNARHPDQFTRVLARLVNEWQGAGLLNSRDRGSILACNGRAIAGGANRSDPVAGFSLFVPLLDR